MRVSSNITQRTGSRDRVRRSKSAPNARERLHAQRRQAGRSVSQAFNRWAPEPGAMLCDFESTREEISKKTGLDGTHGSYVLGRNGATVLRGFARSELLNDSALSRWSPEEARLIRQLDAQLAPANEDLTRTELNAAWATWKDLERLIDAKSNVIQVKPLDLRAGLQGPAPAAQPPAPEAVSYVSVPVPQVPSYPSQIPISQPMQSLPQMPQFVPYQLPPQSAATYPWPQQPPVGYSQPMVPAHGWPPTQQPFSRH